MTSNLILIGENKLKNANNRMKRSASTKIAKRRKKFAYNDENKTDEESVLDSEQFEHEEDFEESDEESDNHKSKNNIHSNEIIQVNCNSIVGDLYKKKLGSGSKG
jgi:hypothetical protein